MGGHVGGRTAITYMAARRFAFGRLFLRTLAMVAESDAGPGNLRTREGMAPAEKNSKLRGKQPELPEPAECSHPPSIRKGVGTPGRPGHRVQRRDAPASITSSTGQRLPGREITHRSWMPRSAQNHF